MFTPKALFRSNPRPKKIYAHLFIGWFMIINLVERIARLNLETLAIP
jgi:hypothetical protein